MSKLTNLLGTITAILSAVTGILATMGCKMVDGSDINATCTISWLDPKYVAIVAAVFGALTFLAKLTRPGGPLASLFGSTAVVVPETSSNSTAGTVTPEQVASP